MFTRAYLLTWLRRSLAFAVASVAVIAWSALHEPWHEVRYVSEVNVALAFYLGPDQHMTAEERAALLEPTERRTCTGVEHKGSGLIGPALGCVALVAVAVALSRARSLALALACLAVVGVFTWHNLWAGLLAHLFDVQGPDFVAQALYRSTTLALVPLTAALATAAWLDRRTSRTRTRAKP